MEEGEGVGRRGKKGWGGGEAEGGGEGGGRGKEGKIHSNHSNTDTVVHVRAFNFKRSTL